MYRTRTSLINFLPSSLPPTTSWKRWTLCKVIHPFHTVGHRWNLGKAEQWNKLDLPSDFYFKNTCWSL